MEEKAPGPPTEGAEGFFGWLTLGDQTTEVRVKAPEAAPEVEIEAKEEIIEKIEVIQEETEEELSDEELFAAAAEAGVLSGDDALSWLEGLAVGKEEELRAEAAAEQEARIAEIMGRKPAEQIEEEEEKPPEPDVEAKAEAPPAEPEIAEEAAAVEEGGMLSGDDALSWLEGLAAGKEEELRAEAAAEQEARIAEIMGRKPAEPEITK